MQSEKEYDWLGPGAYFWEYDATRAMEWADAKAKRTKGFKPACVGAVIDLGECLDLTLRQNVKLMQAAYADFVEEQVSAELELPENFSPTGARVEDRLLRKLDCAVIRRLHSTVEEGGFHFDTVRGVFFEGDPAYAGAGFHSLTHTQIAVRTDACIVGIFRPRDL